MLSRPRTQRFTLASTSRSERFANGINYFWTAPHDPLSVLEIEVSGCSGCLRDPTTGKLDLSFALSPVVTGTYQLSRYKLAFSAMIDPNPYPDNGLVIAIPPVTDGYVPDWWRIDLWLPSSKHAEATAILNSVRVSR